MRPAWAERETGTEAGNERGVSELIGFVLSFSIIVTSVALVYTVGFGSVTDLRGAEQANGAERAMGVLGSNFNTIQRGDPARTSEIRLVGASLSVEDRTELEVAVSHPSGPTTTVVRPRSLVYDGEEAVLRYTAGGVFRAGGSGAIVSRPPSFVCTDEVAIVSLLTLKPGASQSVSAVESITVESRERRQELLFPSSEAVTADDGTAVSITVVDSPNAQAWDRYFRERDGWSASGSTYTCTAEKVHVRETTVTIEFLT
jgi:hypothetical protein